MKRFIVILLLVAMPQFVQSQDEQAKKELTRLLDDFLEGAGKNDLEIHDRFWAKDLTYTSSSGERFGKEQLMKGVRNAEEDYGNSMVWSAEDVQINIYDDTAIVAFRLVGEAYAGEKYTYLNSGTFVKRNGQWEAVNWQATKERAK